MPKWLWGLIILIILLAFVIPNPTGTGTALGNAIGAFVSFITSTIRSIVPG
jgi:hypothetical protein